MDAAQNYQIYIIKELLDLGILSVIEAAVRRSVALSKLLDDTMAKACIAAVLEAQQAKNYRAVALFLRAGGDQILAIDASDAADVRQDKSACCRNLSAVLPVMLSSWPQTPNRGQELWLTLALVAYLGAPGDTVNTIVNSADNGIKIWNYLFSNGQLRHQSILENMAATKRAVVKLVESGIEWPWAPIFSFFVQKDMSLDILFKYINNAVDRPAGDRNINSRIDAYLARH
jgi:hypothetical protein